MEARQLLAGIPQLLGDLAPGADSSDPNEFVDVGGMTFFTANGSQLWKTDGTTGGTVLVHDTGPGVGSIYLSGLHNHDGTLVFARVDDGSDGSFFATDDDRVQLWKSDGSSGGTVMIRDFGIGSTVNVSEGAYFASGQGTLFTAVGTAATGTELWKSDLTSAGTVLVKDINPGVDGSSPSQLFDHEGTLFFVADDGQSGFELWKSDGTSGGTVQVIDIDAVGSTGSYPRAFPDGFVRLGNDFFFAARTSGSDGVPFNDDDTGQLWKSDGTSTGTVLVKDFGPGSYGGGSLINVGGTLFGTVRTAQHGEELWKSDGTSSGTVLVKDINPSVGSTPAGSYPYGLKDVNGVLFFNANDGTHGNELWKSDGTSSGTVMVKDIDPSVGAYSASSSFPSDLANVNGTLYFAADDGQHGRELWKSDGTESGTVLVHDINRTIGAYGSNGSVVYPTAFVNGVLFFGAEDGSTGRELWALHPATDTVDLAVSVEESMEPATPGAPLDHVITVRNNGPAAATGIDVLASLLLPSGVTISDAIASKGSYSGGVDGTWSIASLSGNETATLTVTLSVSSSAGAGTDAIQSTASVQQVDQTDCDAANDSASITTSIDPGSGPNAPRLLKDISPGSEGSFPTQFAESGGFTFFVANEVELWRTDGTSVGTVLVRDVGTGAGYTYATSLHDHQGMLVFVRIDYGSDGSVFSTADNQVQLWKSDGTSSGTLMVHDFGVGSYGGISTGAYFESVDGTLFTTVGTQSTGEELWKSDLKSGGTTLVRDINPGTNSSSPTGLQNLNGTLLFVANDGQTGRELWKTDGTSSGTMLITDLGPAGSVGSYPGGYGNGFAEKDGELFFAALSSGADGVPFNSDDAGQLWKTDGTSSGTVLIKDFGSGSSAGGSLINVGGTLFGTVNTSSHGLELWKSDGTSTGTVLVKDINETIGAYGSGSYPSQLTDVNGTLFFVADDGVHGTELWKSDGTRDGTILVRDINPVVLSNNQPQSSNPFELTNLNGTLYFTANDGVHGFELWKSDGTTAGTVLVKDIDPTAGAYFAAGSYISSMSAAGGALYFSATDGTHSHEPWVLQPVTELDFGDAPATFGTLAEDDGARHVLGSGLFLGNSVDADADGQPEDQADGDDNDSETNDEDGLAAAPRFTQGQAASFDVVASAAGKLDAWIDLNRNGAFDHPSEHINAGASIEVTNGSNTISVQVPQEAALGATYLRLRISSAGNLDPMGFTASGEVEDYYVVVRAVDSTSDWQNPADPLDSNGDGAVSPIDALVIINTLNSIGSRSLGTLTAVPASWYDVNGDGSVSPIDVLQVINDLNRGSGEGEVTEQRPILNSVGSTASGSQTPTIRVPGPLLQSALSAPPSGALIDTATVRHVPTVQIISLTVSARNKDEMADLIDLFKEPFFTFGTR